MLLIGRAASRLHLSVGSAGCCFSLQTVRDVPINIGCSACSVIKQHEEPINGVHGVFVNVIYRWV